METSGLPCALLRNYIEIAVGLHICSIFIEFKHSNVKDVKQVIPMHAHFVAYYLTIFTSDKCCMK